jgi:hypothetical protein
MRMETTAVVLIELGVIAIGPVLMFAILGLSEWRKRGMPIMAP